MGVLRAKVAGNWVDIGGGSGDAVWVGPDAPVLPDTELWYDTDASSVTPPSTFGLEANRPTSGTQAGARYMATDTKREYLWDGAAWVIALVPPSERTYGKPFSFGSTFSTGGAGYADWMTIDAAVIVPPWATRAAVRISVSYLLYATAGGNIYGTRIALGTAFGAAWNFDDASKPHFDLNWTDMVTLIGSGSQSLRIQASRIAGTGTWQAGTFGTTGGVNIEWLP